MLFSALVDADFLDTEAFMNGGKADARDGFAPLDHYRSQLDAHAGANGREGCRRRPRTHDPVMRARADVLQRCRDAGLQAPGVFSLEVPTGGGKTLSSLAFALDPRGGSTASGA